MDKQGDRLLIVTGPTATGKTEFSARLAARLGFEIISADSRQVYRKMDLGTGKDLNDYTVDGLKIPHHLIDIADPGYRYNVFEYQRDFLDAWRSIRSRGKSALVSGGSGMYIDSIVRGYRLIRVPPDKQLREALEGMTLEELKSRLESYKQLHNTSDVDNAKRAIRAIEIQEYYLNNQELEDDFPKFESLIIGISFDRESRRRRISERLKRRLEEGMIDEVKSLLDGGLKPEDLIYYGLEYKYLTMHITGELSYNEMFTGLETAIHQFAKRQMTWFRGMERRGYKIHWLDGYMPMDEKISKALQLLENE